VEQTREREVNWEDFEPYIKYHSSRLSCSTSLSVEEFFQAGVLGALEGLEHVDTKYQRYQIIRFVKKYIFHFMLKQIRELQHAVYIPLHLNSKINSGKVKFSMVNNECLEMGALGTSRSSNPNKDQYQQKVHPDFAYDPDDLSKGCHYKRILECAFSKLKINGLLNEVEVLCYVLHNGLFSYPKFPLEQIGKIIGLAPNTVSKKVLKVSSLLKHVLFEAYDKESIFY
jgi:hypothetical protein